MGLLKAQYNLEVTMTAFLQLKVQIAETAVLYSVPETIGFFNSIIIEKL
jgi:hypothetical protein